MRRLVEAVGRSVVRGDHGTVAMGSFREWRDREGRKVGGEE